MVLLYYLSVPFVATLQCTYQLSPRADTNISTDKWCRRSETKRRSISFGKKNQNVSVLIVRQRNQRYNEVCTDTAFSERSNRHCLS